MNNAEANRPIANRFFEAFDALVAMGKIKSVRSYCDPNGGLGVLLHDCSVDDHHNGDPALPSLKLPSIQIKKAQL